MKFSKTGLLGLSSLFTVMGLWLMAVSIAERQLDMDLDNAVQFIEKAKFISSWSDYSTILNQVGSGSVRIQETNFILTQTWVDKENIVLTGFYSSILWWEKNIIDWIVSASGRNVIFGWLENFINGVYNVILWWERNHIEEGKWTSTILWWRNNQIRWESDVALWSNNMVKNDLSNSRDSVVIWLSGYVEGQMSAALWLNSRVKANNSFLWSDGSDAGELTWDNLFVIMAENGMVINTNTAHSFAKLTLWWPLIISSAENDKNIKCWTWEGGWILKIVNAENQMCLCGCDWSWRNSMLWRGKCMGICDSSIHPVCGGTVKRVCDSGTHQIFFSWNCVTWKPVKWTWAYLMDKYDRVHWSCQTDDGSVVGCVAPVANKNQTFEWCQSYSCQWPIPAGAYLVAGSNQGLVGYVSNTLYSNESEAAGKKCAYVCDSNHRLSEDWKSCVELTYECVWDIPWENTRRWSNITTNLNQEWEYVETDWELWVCEWSCSDYDRYIRSIGNNFCIEHF